MEDAYEDSRGCVLFLVGFILVLLAIWAIPEKENYITSPVKLEPEIKLEIKDNKVDTLYVYRKKQV